MAIWLKQKTWKLRVLQQAFILDQKDLLIEKIKKKLKNCEIVTLADVYIIAF